MIQRTSPAEVKKELYSRMEEVKRPEFLRERILPYLLAEHLDGTAEGWKTEVHQLDGTGAATLEMDLNGEKIFGKFFPDDTGPLVLEKMEALREAGFGAGERYQVVEPLGFVPEYRMLLTRGAPGLAVADSMGNDDEAFVSGVAEAARWLAKLHTSQIRIGPPRSLLDSSEVLSVARRLAKVVKRRPEHASTAADMIRRMEKLAEETVDGLLVQSHGQYRPIHVFVDGSTTTVIDLDRSRPCDPAFDVVEFVHRLRKTVLKKTGRIERAEGPTRAFLETYASEVGDRSYLTNLRFHWSRFVFHSLNNELKDGSDPSENPYVAYCRSEFEDVVEGRLGV